MPHMESIRAGKDEAYRQHLSGAERRLSSDHPAEITEFMNQLAIRSGALTMPVIAERCARHDGWAAAACRVAAGGPT